METIGFLGVGPINAALARLSVRVGMNVLVSNSHGEDSVYGAATSLGPSAGARDAADCASESDIVVISIPLEKRESLPIRELAGKIVVDTCNYYPQRSGSIPELDDKSMTSSEMMQKLLPKSKVVKAFYNLDRWHLENGARPFGSPDRWALPIAGDDESATAIVARWMGMVGFDPVYCGTLADSWKIQAGTSLHILPYLGFPPANLTKEERRIWYRWDHSKRVTDEDIRKLASQTPRECLPYGRFEDLPSGLID